MVHGFSSVMHGVVWLSVVSLVENSGRPLHGARVCYVQGAELKRLCMACHTVGHGLTPWRVVLWLQGAEHVVLVGDHHQLPPVVKSEAAMQGGMDVSLMERLMQGGVPSALLQVRARVHGSNGRSGAGVAWAPVELPCCCARKVHARW